MKRKALDEQLLTAISTEVNSHILTKLHGRLQTILGRQAWELGCRPVTVIVVRPENVRRLIWKIARDATSIARGFALL